MPSNGFEWAWPGKCDDRCAGDSRQVCGGSMAMNLYNTPGQKLDGLCVYDFPDKRVFEGPSITGKNDMTIEKCENFCSEYKFYGVQAGDGCYCGDSDYDLLPSPELECDTSCKGNASQICGGSWRMNVYDSFPSQESDFVDSTIPVISIKDEVFSGSTYSKKEETSTKPISTIKTSSASTTTTTITTTTTTI